mmetsp:Transcript_36001/g.26257  ORF Transcript_36001/g.26257 Transcript_36001/m.26257 type:complete len:90 (-) Transcript_36001:1281-1550(-)
MVFAYSIGKESRRDAAINKSVVNNPGPGTYTNSFETQKKSPVWGVGRGMRSSMENKSVKKVPGPGTYNPPSKIIEGPKFIMGARSKIPS